MTRCCKSRLEVIDVVADFKDFTDELVPNDQRHGNGPLRPGIPLVDVQVGAADAGAVDANQNIIDADRRLRHIGQPQTRLGPAFD